MSSAPPVRPPVEKKEEYSDVREDLPPEVIDPARSAADVSLEQIAPDWLGPRAIVLHGVFGPEECKSVMQYFEGCNVTEKCMARTDYRNNYRVSVQNEAVAAAIFARIRPFLPDTEVVDESTGEFYANEGLGMRGSWKPVGLNPCFRVCKYDPDGHFGPHCDSDYVRDLNHRSLKTFMIYLNDDYGGGTTNFLAPHELHYDEATKRFAAPASAVRAALKARQGDALIFDHNILHEGGTVADGFKYIMRCEVMYERQPEDRSMLSDEDRAAREREDRALELLWQAQQLEASRREMEAVELYRRAFKLCPHLERA
uniref:Fe2OG dioxygenase domain-containing protein n=1 Tax=Neobodo designis TaxID=312471 RepID=A0A7S1M0M5_NEODS|mmetsp:Transcript_31875/g.98629  ORF Transcript_31875/g.98629 Transcript_31875/m.98629 type:complete len:313 (+) Transcript_31875:32-970(+)|eukprot:CAMPEP_0174855340 /NCGR_PEP_ID=MMETSP1114-20130205/33051_1 /TAXON_ID=312471 /ORGANISM="Neobodo designis, Strain CCAP 1951/1" /LENGTH=312 /DNA_ID=CAMNT_0016090077 /DNA_START=32 /DNA_END=970 /DNA_ORIENTATION=+